MTFSRKHIIHQYVEKVEVSTEKVHVEMKIDLNVLDMVQEAGLEPARPDGHMPLKHACLPIPALLQVFHSVELPTYYN